MDVVTETSSIRNFHLLKLLFINVIILTFSEARKKPTLDQLILSDNTNANSEATTKPSEVGYVGDENDGRVKEDEKSEDKEKKPKGVKFAEDAEEQEKKEEDAKVPEVRTEINIHCTCDVIVTELKAFLQLKKFHCDCADL